MINLRILVLLTTGLTCSFLAASEKNPELSEEYKAGYNQGQLEGGAFGEMFGVLSGTIHGHAIYNEDGSFCLLGDSKQRVQQISQKLIQLVKNDFEFRLDDVPTKEQSITFLREHFRCDKK